MPISQDITFGPNDTNHSVTVVIVDNRIAETPEQFVVALSTTDVGVQIEETQRQAVVTILDDDGKSLVCHSVGLPVD